MSNILHFGATGTIGRHVSSLFEKEGHTVLKVGRKGGDIRADIEDPESILNVYRNIGSFDAVVSTVGEVEFAPLESLTAEHWRKSIRSKLMGQIEIVQQGIRASRDGGSFTLISGILSDHSIATGTIATTMNRALEGFVRASACEMPRGLRINAVSPNLLEDSVGVYGAFFPGFIPVSGALVAQAFKRSVFGAETGQVYRV